VSKKSKTENKRKRLQAKRARRASNKAKYDAWRDAGENSKSKRFIKKSKGSKIKLHNHPQIPCGNPACKRCHAGFAV